MIDIKIIKGKAIIPEGTEIIPAFDSFEGRTELTSVEIPLSVKEIGFVTFDHCKQLQEIHFERKGLKSVKRHETMLDGVDKEKCTIFVPKGKEEQYREHPAFEGFKIVEEGQVR